MARQLHHKQIPHNISQAGFAAISLLLCGFALYLCASHSRKWRRSRWGSCYGLSNHEPVIQQLNSEPMMLTTVNNDQLMFSSQQQQGVPVWQKNILMGGKCQLPDFSGVIIYNSDGHIVPPAKKPLPMLTWK
ncbi:uncharacterized protein [Euphorbia lathyris]|uniref:uncharacterized protein n=1 Tax=Euphorbia lathyris TaxID=212925 RepID=UPI0033141DDA